MRRLVFALLFGLVPWSASAQSVGSVTLSVCNAGKVAVDVFLSRAGKVSSSHIGPADCATIAEGTGAMAPAYLGFAFVDSQGRWGAAKRFDLDNYRTGPDGMKQASQSALVSRGNTSVSLPMQWLFAPGVPGCISTGTTVPDRGRIIVGPTYCDQLRYNVTVEAFPESREMGFRGDCDPCDQKAFPQLTAEERAIKQSQREAARIRDAQVSTASPNLMGILNKNMTVVDVAEVGERLERLKPPQQVNWSELLTALRVNNSGRVWDVIPRYIVIRGTVSNVVMREGPAGPNQIRQVNVFFRESPPVADARPQFAIPEFGVCTTNPEVFQDVFGKDFLTSMVGKTIEVQGESYGAACGSPQSCRPDSAGEADTSRAGRSRFAGRPRFAGPCRSTDDRRVVCRLHPGVDRETGDWHRHDLACRGEGRLGQFLFRGRGRSDRRLCAGGRGLGFSPQSGGQVGRRTGHGQGRRPAASALRRQDRRD